MSEYDAEGNSTFPGILSDTKHDLGGWN